jgi:acetylornithine deacetylase/succinyl-diaminopimelate desuccinylase-like protein
MTRGQAPTARVAPAGADVVGLARGLIRAASPNPPGDERVVAAVIVDAAHALGLPPPRRIARDEHRPNLLTTLEFGPGGRHLVLSGHIDTKPIGDARWSADPLGAEIDGDRLYGLGSADMKAAVAAMLVAASSLLEDPPAAGRVSLLFTADEEDGAAFGARHVAATVPLEADGVVIGEPGGIEEDFDRLHLVSRGIARMRLVAHADQGHSSLADELGARNAGVDAARAVVAVRDDLELTAPPDEHGLNGWHATVNCGLAYRGGVGYGVLPGRVAVDTEVRLLPGMERAAVAAAFERTLRAVADRTGAELELAFDAPPNDWLPATLVDPQHPLAAAAERACAAVLGRVPAPAVFPGTTDATWFAELQGTPALPALGPGLLRRAHAADEWVSVDATRRAVDLYAELVRRFCDPGSALEAGA